MDHSMYYPCTCGTERKIFFVGHRGEPVTPFFNPDKIEKIFWRVSWGVRAPVHLHSDHCSRPHV